MEVHGKVRREFSEILDETEAQLTAAEAERDRLAGELERARSVLAFYADPENYRPTGWQGDADPAPVMVDRGTKAAALVSDPAEGGDRG